MDREQYLLTVIQLCKELPYNFPVNCSKYFLDSIHCELFIPLVVEFEEEKFTLPIKAASFRKKALPACIP